MEKRLAYAAARHAAALIAGVVLAFACFAAPAAHAERPTTSASEAANPTQTDDSSAIAKAEGAGASIQEDIAAAAQGGTETRGETATQEEAPEKAQPAFDRENPPELTADIMGEGVIPAEAMVTLFEQSGQPYPADVYAQFGAPTIEDFVDLCIEEAEAEGVRPEVLFSQIVHETGWLQFGGQVSPEQCNFGGLGATNDGAAGATFADVREGLRAQVQHLKAYASTDELENDQVDPRFDLVSRGCAPTVYDLGGRWAVPGDTYGEALMARIQDMYDIAYA